MTLQDLEIVARLAQGGMATVYRARSRALGREVCVKEILPELRDDPSLVEMFVHEAEIATSFVCSAIVEVLDLGVTEDGHYYMVMELVEGRDLCDVIRAAQRADMDIPPAIAMYIARELCRALEYIHGRTDDAGNPFEILHRDISPHNVLASYAGEVKVTDFGIAKSPLCAARTRVGVLKGKFGYMAPEQARGEVLDRRCDIFAAGIVLYELLVGQRCFVGASDFSTLAQMRAGVATPPRRFIPKIPLELEAVVMRALAPRREDRYPRAGEFAAALVDVAERLDLRAGPEDLATLLRGLFPKSATNPKSEEPKSSGATPTGGLAAKAVSTGKSLEHLALSSMLEGRLAQRDVAALVMSRDRADERDARDDLPQVAEPGAAERRGPAPREPAPQGAEPAGVESWAAERRGPEAHRRDHDALSWVFRGPARRRSVWPVAGLAISIALGGGSTLGILRSGERRAEAVFRAAELGAPTKTRRPREDTVEIVIRSEPPGGKAWLDGVLLEGRTPLSVRRPRDTQAHHSTVVISGRNAIDQSFEYSPTRVTIVNARAPNLR